MFNKVNLKTLFIVFGALLVIVALTQWLKKTGNERNFRENLVEVDTAKVTSLKIVNKKDKELLLKKNGNQWDLIINNKTYKTEINAVKNLLAALTQLKSERLVSTEKENWDQYEVTETAGTTVTIEENGKTTAEFIIGKISYQQNYQQVTTYARVKDEQDVFALTGFLVMNFNQDMNSLRYKALGTGNYAKISRITFKYSADSSFTLSKSGNKWTVNGSAVDSTSVYNYLHMITNVSGSEFADDSTPLTQPVFTVLAEAEAKNVFEIKAFPANTENRYFLTSSVNPGAIFSESKEGVVSSIFPAMKHFQKK